MKKIFITLILIVQLHAENNCITVNFTNTSLKLSEKKVCCTILQNRDIEIDARSRNGWYRYTLRNNWAVTDRNEFMKCIDAYFDSSREVRIGGSL